MSPMLNNIIVREAAPRLKRSVTRGPQVGYRNKDRTEKELSFIEQCNPHRPNSSDRQREAGRIEASFDKAGIHSRHSLAMSPGFRIDGKVRHESLDEEIELESGDVGSMHDVIGFPGLHGTGHDPAEAAMRLLDWETFLGCHSQRYRIAIRVLAAGGSLEEVGHQCRLSADDVLSLRHRIAADLLSFFGEEVIRCLMGAVTPVRHANLPPMKARRSVPGASASIRSREAVFKS